jgi:Undecaprenyl-phosphate glucose phosphotransferase
MIKKHQRFFNIAMILLDGIVLLAALMTACLLTREESSISLARSGEIIPILWAIPVQIIYYFVMDVYSSKRSIVFRKEVMLLVKAHFAAIISIYGILYVLAGGHSPQDILLPFALTGFSFITIERFAVRRGLRYLRERGYNQRHLIIIGCGETGRSFLLKLLEHRDFGYNVIGFLDDAPDLQGTMVNGTPVVGTCSDLPAVLAGSGVDEVVIALPFQAHNRCREIIMACENAGIRVRMIPNFLDCLPGMPKIEEVDGIPLLNIRHVPLDDPLNYCMKRVLDIAVSLFAILLTLPLMALIAVVIKLTSPGPVIFRQQRVGLNGRTFDMFKFRTMRVMEDTIESKTWTTADDPRKTRFGSFLRKTSLDELPQFFNVIAGSMSVVGPRPERPFFVEQFRSEVPKYMVKHHVKPGITGWAQVNGWRGDTSIHKRIECDIYYIENWDLLLDIKIIFLTVVRGLVHKNAY